MSVASGITGRRMPTRQRGEFRSASLQSGTAEFVSAQANRCRKDGQTKDEHNHRIREQVVIGLRKGQRSAHEKRPEGREEATAEAGRRDAFGVRQGRL